MILSQQYQYNDPSVISIIADMRCHLWPLAGAPEMVQPVEKFSWSSSVLGKNWRGSPEPKMSSRKNIYEFTVYCCSLLFVVWHQRIVDIISAMPLIVVENKIYFKNNKNSNSKFNSCSYSFGSYGCLIFNGKLSKR